jgi:glycosyltransferase involved in cell wall biosynthesis
MNSVRKKMAPGLCGETMWKWNGKYPKVSIVVLNYNGRGLGPILDQCINSVINQNYPNYEILVVDNGSTDDSVEYITGKYADKLKVIPLGKNCRIYTR